MSQKIFMSFPNGMKKALTLSYDDGVDQDIRLVEILNRYGLKCTFNINSGSYAPEGNVYPEDRINSRRMSLSQAQALYKNSGHEVAVHTLTHPRLERLPMPNITYEVLQDRLNLEKQYGCIVRGMAYPFGTYNDQVVDCLRACGIAYARTVVSTEKFDIPTDWLRMPATCHHKNPRLMTLAQQFLDSKNSETPKLFYLWGHSYEFDQQNNWNVIEDFAALMGGREDIWYATNIEIYDYVQDYQRLIWSADGRMVHNPTSRALFFDYGDVSVELASGETRCFD